MSAINDACRAKGLPYGCTLVSWDDCNRTTIGDALSCVGPNITDTTLSEKNDRPLYTVRTNNWNEKLGKIRAEDVLLLVGNQEPGGKELENITLKEFLGKIGKYGQYAGLSPADLSLLSESLDKECSIRFQTVFLPLKDSNKGSVVEFATQAYNYQTRSNADPRNLILLATSQGIALQQDGVGSQKLFHHAVSADKKIHRHWLEAEQSEHKVGGEQKESKEEKEDALRRGKAIARPIGVPALGDRFNVLLTIQIPLEQQKKQEERMAAPCGGGFKLYTAKSMPSSAAMPMKFACCSMAMPCPPMACAAPRAAFAPPAPVKIEGVSRAARVSRGTEVDVWPGLTVKQPKRNACDHVTVTCVIYNTCAGGVPAESDVFAAIKDLEELYKACEWSGRLAEQGAAFMKTNV